MNNEKLNEMAEKLAIAYAESGRGRKALTVNEMFFFKAGFQAALSLPEVKAMKEALGGIEQILAVYRKITVGEFNSIMFHTGADKALADMGEVMK